MTNETIMAKARAYMNWSGGKDSSLSLHKILNSDNYEITHLLTSINSTHDRISMHGVRRALLEAQAESIGILLKTIELPEEPDMPTYEKNMKEAVYDLKSDGCTHAVFGDIFLEDLRAYRESKLSQLNMNCVFPLWQQNTLALAKEFIALGFRSVVVCVNDQYLDKSFCGRIIDESFLAELPANVDPCGENGEFHSFVFDGPLFREKISFSMGETVYRKYHSPDTKADSVGFYFTDLVG
jgi:uncharacterized protein (TIGR00290 family)